MSVNRDNMFWDALLNHVVLEKKFSGKTKLANVDEWSQQYHMTKEDVEKIYNIFISMDNDDSGTISAAEIAQMLVGFGYDVSPKVIQAVIRSSDKSGDGEIDFEEFMAAINSRFKLSKCEADICVIFERLNESENGLLSTEELASQSETFKSRITLQESATFIQKIGMGDQETVTSSDFITVCQMV